MWAAPARGSADEPQGVCGGDPEVGVNLGLMAAGQAAGGEQLQKGTASMEGRIESWTSVQNCSGVEFYPSVYVTGLRFDIRCPRGGGVGQGHKEGPWPPSGVPALLGRFQDPKVAIPM